MKIAISTEKDTIDSLIDQRFGRCKYFLIIDTDKNELIEAVENQGAIQGHGAGIKAAQQIGEQKVDAVITGQLGPNATNVLKQLGIKAFYSSGIAKDAIDSYSNNKLDEIKEVANAHSGMAQPKDTDNERIFFPLLEDKGLDSPISQHFGHAPFFGVYDVEKKELKLVANDLNHTDPNKSPIDQIEEAVNPTTIFAKGIGGRAIGLIQEKGMKLKTGNYETVQDVIDNLDKLDNQMESCGHEH